MNMAHSMARGMISETAKAGNGTQTEDTKNVQKFREEISWKTSAALW